MGTLAEHSGEHAPRRGGLTFTRTSCTSQITSAFNRVNLREDPTQPAPMSQDMATQPSQPVPVQLFSQPSSQLHLQQLPRDLRIEISQREFSQELVR